MTRIAPIHWLEWPVSERVRACYTQRTGGFSGGAFHSLNLARHVGDDPDTVQKNRDWLQQQTNVPPCWLNQVHGTRVVQADTENLGSEADAAFVTEPGFAAVVMTADCLPVFLADKQGSCAGVAHAGWRGLAAGVIANTIRAMPVPPENVVAYLGPAIGPKQFEVGEEVLEAFTLLDAENRLAFKPGQQPGKWYGDLYQLARRQLQRLGVQSIHGGDHCTVTESDRFYSYRRDGKTGRMANLIWLT